MIKNSFKHFSTLDTPWCSVALFGALRAEGYDTHSPAEKEHKKALSTF
jgi:hypothetical protein